MTAYVEIGAGQVALAAVLILVNIALSVALRLDLGRQLAIASARMVAQLLLLGLALDWIFRLERPLPVVALALVMAGIAGVTAANRTGRRFAGIYWHSLVAVLGSSFLVTGLALAGIVQVEPWYEPQYLIPLLGMVLGNTLNGISLTLDRFLENLVSRRDAVEALLALGATRWEAAHSELREAIRTGMIPTINSMLIMGIVSLPGMMTGQILAGARPTDAVRYQIVIMFMIASTAAIGTLVVSALAFRTLLDRRHRLRLERLRSR